MIDDYDEYALPGDDEDGDRPGLLPRGLQKALLSGVSAVLTTEEGIRKQLGDLRLPKEAIGYLVQQTEKSRRDLFNAVRDELKGTLSTLDVASAMRKALTGLKVEVRADIRFIDDDNAESDVDAKVIDTAAAAAAAAPSVDEVAEPAPPKPAAKKTKRKRKKKAAPR